MAKILIIEDCQATLRMLCQVFQGFGHEVIPTDSLAKGRSFLAEANILVSDGQLPDGNGLMFIKQSLSRYRNLKTVLLSGDLKLVSKASTIADLSLFKGDGTALKKLEGFVGLV